MQEDASEVDAAPGAGGAVQGDDAELVRGLRALLDAATAGPASQNPARAQTSVAIAVQDADGPAAALAVLALDREPVTVEPGPGRAEIELTFPRATLERFLRGDLQLALAIARGEVAFRGPVRKFLRITPVLRALARDEGPGAHPAQLQ
jgi:hypothetical protein